GGEGQQEQQVQAREAQAGLLVLQLRVVLLVGGGVGHGQFAAVGQQDAACVPPPGVGSLAFEGVPDLIGQVPEQGLGELGPGLAVRTATRATGGQAEGQTEDQNPSHGSNTGLAGAEALCQEGPEGDNWGVDSVGVLAEVNAGVVAGILDVLLGENVSERQAVGAGEGTQDGGKGGVRGVERHGASLVPETAGQRPEQGRPVTGLT